MTLYLKKYFLLDQSITKPLLYSCLKSHKGHLSYQCGKSQALFLPTHHRLPLLIGTLAETMDLHGNQGLKNKNKMKKKKKNQYKLGNLSEYPDCVLGWSVSY